MAGEETAVWVRVRPRSSQAGVTLGSDGGLVVRVHAPAAEGAANRELVSVVAKTLGVSRSAVTIARGEKSRRKQIAVEAMSPEEVREGLLRAAREGGAPA